MPAAAQKGTFDASAETAKLIPTDITIEGKEFKIRRTGTALKNVMKLDPGEGFDEDNVDESVRILYQGLSYLLVDPRNDSEVSEEGEDRNWHPTADWLEGNLDFAVAMSLMNDLVPKRGDPDPTDAKPSAS